MFGKKKTAAPAGEVLTPGFLRFSGTDAYITSAPLEQAVNAAIALERPLLIKGEPGTGKTMLAEQIAKALDLKLLRWQIKSTTRAADGLYVYDTVQRLHDSRFGDADVSDIRRYIRFGPLGQSFRADEQVVLLIDEVDKADIEFPNDLLHELDAMSFDVVETSDHIEAKRRPIVVITSNNEKELPDAFLRRCVFHYIAFPDTATMTAIVKVHFPTIEQRLLDDCVASFYALREVHGLRKRPSTSELLDWIAALRRSGIDTTSLSLQAPFLGTLIKNERDLETVAAAASGRRR
ncbi:MAG: ATP-binding protein [Proteobacteria bacterium]|nr:MAG: ATP-binding protein [Pseudomonadota bacterium]PIE19037.1 MAG: ATP-binding protein [Pseudomonadota bacterium]